MSHQRRTRPNCMQTRSIQNWMKFVAAFSLPGTASWTLGATYTYVGSATGDVNSSVNWSSTGIPSGAANDTAVFDGAVAGALTLTNSGTVTTASSGITLSITSASALTIDSSAALWRLGNSALTIGGGAGTFSLGNGSGTTVSTVLGGSGGTTQTFTNNSANIATINSDVMFTPGGNGNHVMAFTGSGNWNLNNPIANTGTDKTQNNGLFAVSKTGAGTVTLSNNNNIYSGNTTVSNGTLKVTANNALGYAGQYALNRAAGTTTVDGSTAAATLDLGGATTVNEPIVLAGSTQGANLINSNTSSPVTVGNGIAAITFSNAGTGYGASTGFNSLTTTISGGGGSGATATAWKGSSGGAGVNVVFMGNPGSGYTSLPTVTITGTNSNSDAVATAVLSSITLNGTNNNIGGDGTLTIAAAIGEAVANSGFNKIGTGSTTLSGSNTFTGTTKVNAGTLAINGSLAGPVTVGAILTGDGAVNGSVTINSSGHLSPGNGVGNFSARSLVLNAGAILDYTLGVSSDKTTLSSSTASLNLAGNSVVNLSAGSGFGVGTYTLIDYAGTGNTVNTVNLSLGAKPTNVLGRFVNDSANTNVNLEVGVLDYSVGTVGSPAASLSIVGANPNYIAANANFEASPLQAGSINITYSDVPGTPQFVLLDLVGNAGLTELAEALTASGYTYYSMASDPMGIVHAYQSLKDYDLAIAFTPATGGSTFHFAFDVSVIGGGGIAFENIAVVPEPGTLGLVAVGVGGLLTRRRRIR